MMKRLALLLIVLSVGSGVRAEKLTGAYRLGADDSIAIQVLKQPDFSGQYLLPPDGVISLPGVGPVCLLNLTIPEATALITRRLQERLREPEVVVSLLLSRSQRVYVLGAVARPGPYDLQPHWRVLEALSAAGGLTVVPQECLGKLLRPSLKEPVVIKLTQALAAEPAANVALQAGDVLVLETTERLPVYLTGSVRQPGLIDLRVGSTAREALAQAGGLTLPVAEVRVMICRGATRQEVNLDETQLPPLERGDLLLVEPRRSERVWVSGQVRSPGFYDLRAEADLSEALSQAGGAVGDPADLVVVLTRGDQREIYPVTSVTGPTARRIAVRHGDLLAVQSLRTVRVMVSGRVTRPGLIDLKEGEGVWEALTLAGGPLPDAALSQVKVIRGKGEPLPVNLRPTLGEAAPATSFPMQTGDLLIVPEHKSTVAVLGFVTRPGQYDLPEGGKMTVAEAIGLANGHERRRAGIDRVAVLRQGTDGQEQRLIVNLGHYFKTGDARQNPLLQTRDIVYVPETHRIDWAFVFQMLSTSALVYNAIQ